MTTQLEIAVALGIVAVAAVIGRIIYPKLVVTLPKDGAGAKPYKFTAVHGQRYTEMFLVGGNAITKDLSANVYNSTGLNGGETTGNSSPAELLNKVDVKSLKERYHVLSAFKNGPRLWTLDWFEGDLGKELDFDGLKARWCNWLDLKGMSLKPGEGAYKNITVGRHTKMGIQKGTRAFILEDPEGNTWVMKSMSLITYPDQKAEELGTLGSRLKLPAGWKFRAPVLDKDLILTPDNNGIAHITQDDFGNTYDRAGGPYSNFNP